MSIYKVSPEDISSFTVVTNPTRHYTSSSLHGSTGSVYVFARRSSIEKEVAPLSSFIEATHDDVDLSSTLKSLQSVGLYSRVSPEVDAPYITKMKTSFAGMMQDYLEKVNEKNTSVRKQKALEIIRFTPSFNFTSNTLRKLVVKDQLSSYYKTSYPSAHWAYTNYNCLSFYTSSLVPTSSCLLFPNVEGGQIHEGFVSGTYTPSGAISFDFYVNPRYLPDQIDGSFKAGTIYHLSSTYALSLVSGSAKDENGKPLGFRLKLQLSHSADIKPSIATNGAYPNDLVFLSSDNALKYNNWHHVVVRWGTNLVNKGTGSFNIDGVDRGTFVVPSGTITPRLFDSAAKSNPDALVIGNYYEGKNEGIHSLAYFFANDPATRDGLTQMIDDVGGIDEPTTYAFNHPLNADLHDLSIKRYYMSDLDISTSASMGPKSINDGWTAFYLPPFFVEESPFRQFVGLHGGILQTPFFEVDGSTNDPFNVALSFGVGGHYINTENFVRDFASNVFPRLHHMTGTALTNTTTARSANEFLYDQPFVRRRNTFIMPCDDGLFVPSYELLSSESAKASARDDLGIEELSFIHLDEMIMTASILFGSDFNGDQSFVNEQIGFTPEQPGLAAGSAFQQHVSNVALLVACGSYDPGIQSFAPLTIYQRTLDPSSNQVTFFDISNLYYGKRILPGSLELTDSDFSGSGGAISITLKDNGRGTLYRADCYSSASTWNSVGTVFYDEGIIAIKSPHLYFFGKEGFEITFKGEQNVHVMSIDVLAPANQLNSSSNPNFMVVPPTQYPNDPEKEFVYISGINFHDDNMNVIMKTQLAQPVIKRPGDRIMIKVRHDF